MVHPGALLICVVLVSLGAAAFIPVENFPENEEHPIEKRLRCPGRRHRRLPTTMTMDLSLIQSRFLESSVVMEDTHSRSLSPWEYSLNTDANRFPFVISEANCLTFACVDADGNDSPELMSYPIQQEVLVLRREQKGCGFSYRLESEEVTLGCTCVRPRLQHI